MDEPHDELFFESSGIVRTCVDDNQSDYPASPYFIYPTRLTRPGPTVVNLWERAKGTLTGDVQTDALILMHAVHTSLVYTPGVTDVGTTAEQALSYGKGVCQDFSHVLLSLLRLASIPSLYVAGLMAGEGATHAWVQAWVNNRWMALDPTHDCLAEGAYIALARGCDFEDGWRWIRRMTVWLREPILLLPEGAILKTQPLNEAFSWEVPGSLCNRLPWLKLSKKGQLPRSKERGLKKVLVD